MICNGVEFKDLSGDAGIVAHEDFKINARINHGNWLKDGETISIVVSIDEVQYHEVVESFEEGAEFINEMLFSGRKREQTDNLPEKLS